MLFSLHLSCINTSCKLQSIYRSSWLWGPSCHLCWPCRLSGGWLLSVNTKNDFYDIGSMEHLISSFCCLSGRWFLTSLCQHENTIVKHGLHETSNKIFMPGHRQRDHPQLRRGQGQHHRGVDASKCHVRRGRLPGDLFTKYSSIVVVKAEEAYNV